MLTPARLKFLRQRMKESGDPLLAFYADALCDAAAVTIAVQTIAKAVSDLLNAAKMPDPREPLGIIGPALRNQPTASIVLDGEVIGKVTPSDAMATAETWGKPDTPGEQRIRKHYQAKLAESQKVSRFRDEKIKKLKRELAAMVRKSMNAQPRIIWDKEPQKPGQYIIDGELFWYHGPTKLKRKSGDVVRHSFGQGDHDYFDLFDPPDSRGWPRLALPDLTKDSAQ